MTTTDTQQTTTEARLIDLPPDLLIPNPLNLRAKLGDLRSLTRSVTEVGVVVPLVVTPADDSDGRYLVVAGHRRLAAATAAGLTAVPCVIRNMDLAAQTEAMLCENGAGSDRVGLDPIEEAAGYLRLVELGATARKLAAKVGRSAKHVARRLALLELPPAVQQAVAEHRLSVADAEALLRVKDDPELIVELLALPDWSRHDVASVIDRRLAERERHAAAEAAIAEAQAKGLTVISAEELAEGKARKLTQLGLDPKAHRKEPCHAVVVDAGWRSVETIAVCTDPRRHSARAKATDRSALQVTPTAVAGRDAEDTQRRAERKRVARRRTEFVADLLARRLPRTDAITFALHALIDEAGQDAKARAGSMLGVEAAKTHWGGKDWATPIRELAERSAADLLRAAFAVACGRAEDSVSTHSSYGPATARYLTVLASVGYEPDPYEAAELTAAADRTEASMVAPRKTSPDSSAEGDPIGDDPKPAA